MSQTFIEEYLVYICTYLGFDISFVATGSNFFCTYPECNNTYATILCKYDLNTLSLSTTMEHLLAFGILFNLYMVLFEGFS